MICLLAFSTLPRSALAQQVFADSAAVRQLKEEIQRRSPDIAARRAALEAARAHLLASTFGPAASLGAEVEEVPRGFDVSGAGSLRIDVSREFLPGSLRSARRAVAEAGVDRAQAELELSERGLGARVDRVLAHAVGAAAIAHRLAAEDSLLAAAEEGVRVRFAVGDARYVDVLRLRTERLRVQTDAATALTEARIGRMTLSSLISADAPRQETIAAAVDSVVASELRDPFRMPLHASPSLDSLIALSDAARLGRIAVDRARASLQLARAEQRSSIVGSLGLQRFATDDGGFTTGVTLGASMSLPFTARRGNRAGLTAAERDMAATEAARQAALASVRAELVAAYQRYEASRERLGLYDATLLRGARDERESALAAYRSGELSLLELLDFERALARAEIARLRSRIEASDALADLIAIVAGERESSPNQFISRPERDR